ncbi:hypothetical protein ABZ511_06335 [Nocardia gamkensis]|uniref:hypothetical protein n=1 Tax=Nocardia gamkensis TaxID=352869 RepID=UPI0033FF376E
MTTSTTDIEVDIEDTPAGTAPEAAEKSATARRGLRKWFVRLAALSKRATLISAAVIALLLAAMILTVVLLGNSLAQHRAIADSAQAARDAAQSRIPVVLSYDFHTVDTEFPKAAENLTGTFREDFGKLGSTVIISAAHRDSIVTKAKVVESSVISASADKVDVLLFVNQETTSSKYQGPRLDGSRVRVTMTQTSGKWLISEITPI